MWDITISFNNDRNGGGLYFSEITKANTAMYSFAQPRLRDRHGLNVDSWADYTDCASCLTACCLACTVSHCLVRGVIALSMLIDKMRAPLQLGGSPGVVLFEGESQKEGLLSTNYIFWEGQKSVFNQWLSCETVVELITPPNWEGARDNYMMLTHLSSSFTRWSTFKCIHYTHT